MESPRLFQGFANEQSQQQTLSLVHMKRQERKRGKTTTTISTKKSNAWTLHRTLRTPGSRSNSAPRPRSSTLPHPYPIPPTLTYPHLPPSTPIHPTHPTPAPTLIPPHSPVTLLEAFRDDEQVSEFLVRRPLADLFHRVRFWVA